MIPWPDTAYIPEFKKLRAIVGGGRLSADSWPEWDRLLEKYGWKLLLRAADRCEPLSRWPANTEAMCIELKKAEEDAQVKPVKKMYPSKEECAARAAEFVRIRAKHGLRTPNQGETP